MNAERPSDKGSSPADRFDFDRLERSVEILLEEHASMSAEREALLAELVDREHRIGILEARLEAESKRRASAVDGVDRILARLEELESDLEGASTEASP